MTEKMNAYHDYNTMEKKQSRYCMRLVGHKERTDVSRLERRAGRFYENRKLKENQEMGQIVLDRA
jgi:hypothetical protein